MKRNTALPDDLTCPAKVGTAAATRHMGTPFGPLNPHAASLFGADFACLGE